MKYHNQTDIKLHIWTEMMAVLIYEDQFHIKTITYTQGIS